MMNFKATNWGDYELVDTGSGRRLERYGRYLLDRPDPQIIWPKGLSETDWQKADAYFRKTESDRGMWDTNKKILDRWGMIYSGIRFYAKLSPFKHTGVFPEQTGQWKYISDKIKVIRDKSINLLNLFGYTGIASLFAASVGAKVTHVDASRPAIGWARENQELAGLVDRPIRWILDDAIKFCQREEKRGNRYDAVIMDPPIYGHGPAGEKWSFNADFPRLMEIVARILSPTPLFVIVNAYAVTMSAITLENTLRGYLDHLDGSFDHGELTLEEKSKGRLLSTGIWAGWER